MIDAVSTALSGLNSATKRIAVAGENIAKANVEGRYPQGKGEKTDAYLPKEVIDRSLVTGGVLPEVIERKDGYRAAYNPDSPKANSDGVTAVPDISIDEQLINSKLAEVQYTANAAVIKSSLDTERHLLDILA
jgi:flagellar basal-body rod protein FlgC